MKHFSSVSVSKDSYDWLQLELSDGQRVSTRLLIGADGHQSLVRQIARINTVQWDYNQQAVVAVLLLDCQETDSSESEVSVGCNDTAWQRFLPTGPLAVLPLSDKTSCLIWTTSPVEARSLVSMSSQQFTDAVNHALCFTQHSHSTAAYLDNIIDGAFKAASSVGLGWFSPATSRQLPPNVVGVEEGSRATFPLGLCHASQYVDRRVALVGDSAHRIHPLAGQGVNLGFGDVQCLLDQLVGAVYRGEDIGSLFHLREYESLRRRRVVPMTALTDLINRIYSNTLPPFVLLRSAACKTANSFRPINAAMIKFATD